MNRPGEPQRFLYTFRQAAALLAVSPRLLRDLVDEGRITSVEIGRWRLVAHSDLVAYVESLRPSELSGVADVEHHGGPW